MSIEDAHKLALKVLKEVMEDKVDENNVQLAQVRDRLCRKPESIRPRF